MAKQSPAFLAPVTFNSSFSSMTSSLRAVGLVFGLVFSMSAIAAGDPTLQRVAIPGGATCEYGSPELPHNFLVMQGFRSATVVGRIDIAPNSPPAAVVIEHSSGFAELDQAVLLAMKRIRCTSPETRPRMVSALQSFVFNVDEAHGIPIASESAPLFAGHGLALGERNKVAEAEGAYADAIRMDPKYAAAYSYRAMLRERNGRMAEALADLDEAIKLNPQYTWALRQRASLRFKMGDKQGASEDQKLAMRLLPRVSEQWVLGRDYFDLGDFRRAAEALRIAVQAEPGNAFRMMYSYAAARRAGEVVGAQEEFDNAAKDLNASAWPYTIVEYLRGRASARDMLAVANGADESERVGRVCEASFYMAQKELIDGHADTAKPLLEAAQRDCPKTFIEYASAVAELGRMTSAK
jgi:lipoprotein NlpI